tara:strand:+ start:224 stop:469 length:246 start_codon:yes stop_codon:yes gene_type:complete
MNINNILKEDVFSSFFKSLFGIKDNTKKKQAAIKKKINKNIKDFNSGMDDVYSVINQGRKKRGEKPLKPKHLTAKQVLKKR